MTSANRHRTLQWGAALAALWVGVPAWAQPADPPEDAWRHEKIVQVLPLAALPSHVDTHCLETLGGEKPEAAIVLRFRVGRAHHYQAYPVTPEREWKPGDEAAFVPLTCDIRPYSKP